LNSVRSPQDPPLVCRERPQRGTVELNPHSVTVIGNSPLLDVVIDCGAGEPVTVLRLPTDLACILRNRLDSKLKGNALD
jgi:hypothetical protein